MATNEFDRVVPLNQLDGYAVADGEPDIRGWEVMSGDGRRIGAVDQLLVDTEAMKVRYLDVHVDDAPVAGGRHALIPIERARLEEERSRVLVDSLASTQVAGLPAYAHGPVTRDMDAEISRPFGAAPARRGDHDEEARIVRSEEQLAVGTRPTRAGELRVRKRVETEHVREPVQLSHEEVTVERRPVTGPAMGAEARIQGGEVHLPLMAEEAVVEKRVVPKEELVVRKREVEDQEVVEADLRKERLEVDRHGDARRDAR